MICFYFYFSLSIYIYKPEYVQHVMMIKLNQNEK